MPQAYDPQIARRFGLNLVRCRKRADLMPGSEAEAARLLDSYLSKNQRRRRGSDIDKTS
jgi:hypothetical protein